MNLPNKLSVLRLVLIPVFMAVFYIQFPFHYFVAAAVFALAAFTDFLDGYIARKYNLITDLGKFLDSSADKVLVLVALVLLVDVSILPTVFGGICVSIVIAREILISCLRMVAAAKGTVMQADKLGKLKTLLQDFAIIFLIIAGSFASFSVIFWIGAWLLGLSVIMALVSAIHYVYVNKHALDEGKKENKEVEPNQEIQETKEVKEIKE